MNQCFTHDTFSIDSWFDKSAEKRLNECVEKSKTLLIEYGLIESFLFKWVKKEIKDSVEFEDEENRAVDEYQQKHKELAETNELKYKQMIYNHSLRVAITKFARQVWGGRINQLFLEKKSSLDKASCKLIVVREKDLAMEIYHRINSGEISFESAASEFSTLSSLPGGHIPFQSVQTIPYGIGSLLKKMTPGKLSLPMRFNEHFCIIKLNQYEQSQLDEKTEESLLLIQFDDWLNKLVKETILPQLRD